MLRSLVLPFTLGAAVNLIAAAGLVLIPRDHNRPAVPRGSRD